jgi:hypothetical protein
MDDETKSTRRRLNFKALAERARSVVVMAGRALKIKNYTEHPLPGLYAIAPKMTTRGLKKLMCWLKFRPYDPDG